MATTRDRTEPQGINTTAEQALRESEARFRMTFEQSPLSLQILSPDGRTLDVNPAWERLWGVTLNDIADYNLLEDAQLEDQGIAGLIRRAFEGEACELPEISYKPDRGLYAGQERWTRAFIYPVKVDGEIKQVILVHEDITERKQAEISRMASEARFRQLADTMPAIVWSSNSEGNVDYVNRHYYEYTGIAPEIPGPEGWKLAVHPEDFEPAFGHYAQALEQGVVWEHELRIRRHDGQYRWHLSRSVPFKDGEGRVTHWYATSIDIDEQKATARRIEEEAKALETINQIGRSLSSELNLEVLVQSLTDLATELIGAQFGSFFYNVLDEKGESYYLYTLSGVQKSAFEGFPMPRNTAVFDPTFQGTGVVRSDDITKDPRYGQNPPYNGMPEGHLPVSSYLALPVISRSGDVLGGLFFGHSQPAVFTERHERMLTGIASQAAIAMDNARLYHRLTTLNAELEERVKLRTAQLEAANKEMEGFTYSVSHDLRGPLRAIMSTSMILREDHAAELSPDALEQLDRQAKAANKLGTLIDDLLKLSRLSRQQMERSTTDLSQLAREVFEELTAKENLPELRLAAEPGLTANVDPKLFRLVFLNFIDNAVKFSPNGGTITFGKETVDGTPAFFIKDEGIGFDEHYAEKMFLPFERLVLETEFPGTGIGLANVKRIIERHDGSVWATGERGKGSTFYFSLPD